MAEQSWTNDPITSDPNRIKYKVVHFNELQDAINAWETAYSISNTNFTDSPAIRVKIRKTVITEMQDALDALLQLADSNDFTWTERPVIRTNIKSIHINDLRDNMNTMQNDYCYQCDSCDTDSGCACNTGCYGDPCATCDTTCHQSDDKWGNCTLCNRDCHLDPCSTCDGRCHPNTCSQCHSSSYRYPWT